MAVPEEQYINGALAMAKLAMLAAFDQAQIELDNAMRMARRELDRQRKWHEKALTYGTPENRALIEALHKQHQAEREAQRG